MSNRLISEPRILKTVAGYYVGYQYWEPIVDAWLPYGRVTTYFTRPDDSTLLQLKDYLAKASCKDDSEDRAYDLYQVLGINGVLARMSLNYLQPHEILELVFGKDN